MVARLGRIGRIAVGSAVLLAVAGCTAESGGSSPMSSAEPTVAPSSGERSDSIAGSASSVDVSPLPDGVLGSASLVGADGARLATAEVVRTGSDVAEIRVEADDPASIDGLRIVLSPRPLDAAATCFDSGLRFSVGDTGEPGRFGLADIIAGDPSFLDEVVLVRPPDPAASRPECFAEVVARGRLDWRFTPLRAGLVAEDSGSTGGARGEATTAGGEPVSYTVAAGDLLDEVAARFGLTADDLLYLNPERTPPSGVLTLHPGEVLNLTVDRR